MYLTVYLDTAPLYALLEARDQAHEHAKAIFRKATEAGATLLCPYPAALELHRLLITRKPAQPEQAHRTIKAVLSSYSTAMPSEEDKQAALTLLDFCGSVGRDPLPTFGRVVRDTTI